MEAEAIIIALRQLEAACAQRSWKGRAELELTATQPLPFALFRTLGEADIFAALADENLQRTLDEGREGQAPAGEQVILKLPQVLDRWVVVPDLPSLLAIPGAKVREPAVYALLPARPQEPLWIHRRGEALGEAPTTVRRYHHALRLWAVLQGQAHHIDDGTGALLFFGLRRTEICPGFTVEDLAGDIAVEEIEAFIRDEDRKTTRAEIFASTLSEFLRDHNGAMAFRVLLRGSDRFARRLKEGLAIFLAEHSPEKLAEEAKSAGLGISEKLEKIIGGLETKSLTIPAALLLAVKDVEPGAGTTGINLIIVAAVLTYAVTMTLVHRSQAALLELTKQTIATTEDEFRSKGLDDKNPVLTTAFRSLKARCAAANIGSAVMCGGSWVPLLCVVATVGWGTPKTPASTAVAPVKTMVPATKNTPPSITISPAPVIKFTLPAPTPLATDPKPTPPPQAP